MLRSKSERAELDGKLGSIVPYWDRKLRYNKKEYKKFVQELDKRSLIEWVTDPVEYVAFFFVWKKNGVDRRLIVDARRANRAFADPPGVALLSSEGFARMEWHDDGTGEMEFEMATADIDNCFHRYKMPKGMCRYFCLEPIPLKDTPLRRPGMSRQEALRPVWPALSALPMGFSWSLYLAQRAAENVAQTVPRCLSENLVHDRSRPAVFDSADCLRYFVYVDNVGVLSGRKGEAKAVLDNICEAMEDRNLTMHEKECGSGSQEILGVVVDGQAKEATPTAKRRWRLDRGIRWILRRKTVSGKQLEKLLGHATFLVLLGRDLRCTFKASYAFVEASGDRFTRLWPSPC